MGRHTASSEHSEYHNLHTSDAVSKSGTDNLLKTAIDTSGGSSETRSFASAIRRDKFWTEMVDFIKLAHLMHSCMEIQCA
jgi:hypothetical protein